MHSTASSHPTPRSAARNSATSLAVEPSLVFRSCSSSAAASCCEGWAAQTKGGSLPVAEDAREGREPTLASVWGMVRLIGSARLSTLSSAPACRSEKVTSGPDVVRLARVPP